MRILKAILLFGVLRFAHGRPSDYPCSLPKDEACKFSRPEEGKPYTFDAQTRGGKMTLSLYTKGTKKEISSLEIVHNISGVCTAKFICPKTQETKNISENANCLFDIKVTSKAVEVNGFKFNIHYDEELDYEFYWGLHSMDGNPSVNLTYKQSSTGNDTVFQSGLVMVVLSLSLSLLVQYLARVA